MFGEYISYAMGVSVVRGESAVGVPLRQLFRYEWIDVNLHMLNDWLRFRTSDFERCILASNTWKVHYDGLLWFVICC
jgi:hypothetical protein